MSREQWPFFAMPTLRELWRNQKPPSIPLNCKEQETSTTAFLKSKKPRRLAYQKLVEAKRNHEISSEEKWTKVSQKLAILSGMTLT